MKGRRRKPGRFVNHLANKPYEYYSQKEFTVPKPNYNINYYLNVRAKSERSNQHLQTA